MIKARRVDADGDSLSHILAGLKGCKWGICPHVCFSTPPAMHRGHLPILIAQRTSEEYYVCLLVPIINEWNSLSVF